MKIFMSIILLLLLVLNLGFEVDEGALKVQDEAFDRAMIAFGLAKGLNAIISLIQGTELSFTPVGVGLNFSIGEVLDPFNDIVERFSWVMLGASVSLGIQKILLSLSAKVFLQVLFALGVAISIFLLWSKKVHSKELFVYSFKFFMLLFIFRFSAIIFVYSSNILYITTLQEEYEHSSVVVMSTKVELQELQEQNKQIMNNKNESGFFSEFENKYSKLKNSLDLSKQLDGMQESIELASRNIVNLITIFILQTILMPLLFLWLMILSIKAVFHLKFEDKVLNLLYNH